MNNIEIKLIADRNWREENLLKGINNQGKRHSAKSLWTLFGVFPVITDIELFHHTQKRK